MQFSGSQRTLPIYISCCGVTPGPVRGTFFHLHKWHSWTQSELSSSLLVYYADDYFLTLSAMNDLATLKEELNKELDEVQKWLQSNKRKLTLDTLTRFNFIVFCQITTLIISMMWIQLEQTWKSRQEVSINMFPSIGVGCVFQERRREVWDLIYNWKDMQRLMEIMAFRLIKNYQRGKLTPYYNM